MERFNKTISVIIPCFNEEAVLKNLFDRLTAVCEKWDYQWEVICVDDGSIDNTWGILQGFQCEHKNWKALSFSRNFGHQTAVSAGLFHAKGDCVFVVDADLQDPPEEFSRFVEKWEAGYDVVYGVRKRRKENAIKKFAYWLFYRVLRKLVDFDIPIDSGDFCLMSRRVVNVLNQMPERGRFIRGLRAWAGFRQIGIPYFRAARAAGSPKYTFGKLVQLALDGLISFSGIPLKICAHIGFYISLFSIVGVLFTFSQRIFRPFFESIGLGPVPGFATTVIAILFMGGIQLIFLGVIGEYLYRIFEEVKKRPSWIIKETAGFDFMGDGLDEQFMHDKSCNYR